MEATKFRTRHPVWFGLAIAAGTVMTLFAVVVAWFVWAISHWGIG